MFDKVNLEEELKALRNREKLQGEATLSAFRELFQADWEREKAILNSLKRGAESSKLLQPVNLDEERIFSLSEIKKLCLKYRLRFLSTKYFKKDYPQDALAKIKETEAVTGQKIDAFAILAPASMFKLEDANKDPLLFAPLSDGRFYLIHKWGGDLNGWRRILAWPAKTLANLLITLTVLSITLAAIIPTDWLLTSGNYFNFYRFGFVGFNLIFLTGIVSYFWLALNQKFSVEAWNSSTFN
jgi:hypothetical protein